MSIKIKENPKKKKKKPVDSIFNDWIKLNNPLNNQENVIELTLD